MDGDLLSSFDSLYKRLMWQFPLYGDLTYGVRVRPVYDNGSRVVEGNWSEQVKVGPATMCPLLSAEHHAAEWNDLGCARLSGADNGSTALASSAPGAGGGRLDYGWFWSMVGSDLCTGWFDSTPAKFTWGNPAVVRGWGVMWVLAVTALALMIFWQGIRMTYDMWLHGGWTNQRDPGFREMVPRFVLAIILAAASLWICRLVIVLASNVSCYVATSLDVSLWKVLLHFFISLIPFVGALVASAAAAAAATAGLGLGLLIIVLGFVVAFLGFFVTIFAKLLFQLILRVALLSVLVVLSPLAFMLLASPDTEGYFKKWLDMFVITIITQSVQLVVLFVGFRLSELGDAGVVDGELYVMIASIAILYLATKVPELLDRYLGQGFTGGGGVVESAVGAASSAAQRLRR